MKNLIDYIIKENSSNINKQEIINFIKKYFNGKISYNICGNGEQLYTMSKYPAIAVDNIGELNGNNIICKLPISLERYEGKVRFDEGEWENIHVIINGKFEFFIDIGEDLGYNIYDKFVTYGAEYGPDLKHIKISEYKELIKDMNLEYLKSEYSEISKLNI